MKQTTVTILLLLATHSAFACKPFPPPPGVVYRWASPEEAQSLVPFIAVGTFPHEADELIKERGFRFVVERWIKGSGPSVIHMRGSFHTDKSKLRISSCMIQIPVNARLVVLFKSVEQDGKAEGIHHFTFLKEANLFVGPLWTPDKFGL